MIITYPIGDSLYLNVTNFCSNACSFCLREAGGSSDGIPELWLEREPTVEEIISDLEGRNLGDYNEVVFCGYGEPLSRFDDCREVAKWLKSHGAKTRVNTNGQASLITGRDVTAEMHGLFDVVSISLNNKNASEYQANCRSEYGVKAYDALLEFGEKCAKSGIETLFTVLDLLPAEDIAVCEKIANERGCKLRVRKYIV